MPAKALRRALAWFLRSRRVPHALRSAAAEIFAFDVIIRNYDRKGDNPNLLWDRTKILMIDHEGALKPTPPAEDPSISSLELDKFYDHVFFWAVSSRRMLITADSAMRLGAFLRSESTRSLANIPVQWQIEGDLAKVRGRLLWVVEHREQVCTLIRDRLS